MPAPITTSETQVNTATVGDQWDPTVTLLADGGWVVVWMGRVAIGSETGIFAQRYDASGAPFGGEFQVNTASPDQWEGGPSVAALPDGGWIVTWYATSPHGGPSPASALAYTQRYDSTGAPAGEVQVNAPDGYFGTLHSDVAVLADGGWVIVWHSQHSGTDADEDIYAQRYDSTGAPMGGEFQINSTAALQILPSVTALDDGGWIATWMSQGQDGSGWGVYAQRYNADGSAAGGEILVTTTTAGDQQEAHLTTLDDGGWVIVWSSNGQDGSGHGIFAQRYDSTGAPVGGELQLNTTMTNDQLYATVEALPDGGYAVAWISFTGGSDPYGSRTGNIYVQRFDAAGDPVGGETFVGVSSEGSHSNISTRLTALADGSLVVTWGQYGTDGSGYGIYARTFDAPVNVINGTEGDDDIVGTPNADNILGHGGNDTIQGRGANDTLDGGDGDDLLFGDGGINYNGPSGNDVLLGGSGDDFLRGGAGVDSYDGGDGFDRVSFIMRAATEGVVASIVTQTVSNDGFGNAESMVSVEGLGAGTAFADHFTGDDNANLLLGDRGDTLIGNGGNDDFQAGSAPTLIDGGTGTDVLQLTANGTWLLPDSDSDGLAELAPEATSGWFVNLASGALFDGYGNSGAVTGIENVDGSALADGVAGDNNANVLKGLDGDDFLFGGGGADALHGGRGNDAMAGGSGADWFVVEAESGDDRITDFADGVDIIAFDPSSGVGSFSDLTITKMGKDALIAWGTGDSLLLLGVKPKDLSAADFQFGTAMFSIGAVGSELGGGRSAAHMQDYLL